MECCGSWLKGIGDQVEAQWMPSVENVEGAAAAKEHKHLDLIPRLNPNRLRGETTGNLCNITYDVNIIQHECQLSYQWIHFLVVKKGVSNIHTMLPAKVSVAVLLGLSLGLLLAELKPDESVMSVLAFPGNLGSIMLNMLYIIVHM